MSAEVMNNMIKDAKYRFNENDLRKYAQGATYVKFQDMIRIHLFQSSDKQNINVVDDRPINERGSREENM